MAGNMSVEQHHLASATVRGLFVSTKDVYAPSFPSLIISPVSATSAKLTETPRKLKEQRKMPGDDNNNEVSEPEESEEASDGDENQNESPPRPVLRINSGTGEVWTSRSPCYSPRPKRPFHLGRRPAQSSSSTRAIHLQEDSIDLMKSESFRLGNQMQLERIQEADSSDESDGDADYDGDGEEGEAALQLYKSLSGGDLLVRYDNSPSKTSRRPSLRKHKRATHQTFDEEDDDVVRI